MSAAPAAMSAVMPPSMGAPTGPPGVPSGGLKGCAKAVFDQIKRATSAKVLIIIILFFMILVFDVETNGIRLFWQQRLSPKGRSLPKGRRVPKGRRLPKGRRVPHVST